MITLEKLNHYRLGFDALLEEQPWVYLIVDPAIVTRKFITNTLERAQCDSILDFKDADALLRSIKTIDFSQKKPVFIIDLNLPTISGAELTQKLKENETFKHAPILLMTDDTRRHKILTALRSGASCVLAKPFDAAYLIERLKQVESLPIQWAPMEED